MGLIKVRLSRESKRDIASRLRKMSKIPKRVIASAANDAAKVMRTRVSTLIREKIRIKKEDLDKRIRIVRADESRTTASVWVSHSERLSLKYFNAVATKRRAMKGREKLSHGKRGRPTKEAAAAMHIAKERFLQRANARKRGGVRYRITPTGSKVIEQAFIGKGKLNEHVYIRINRWPEQKKGLGLRGSVYMRKVTKLFGVSPWGILVSNRMVFTLRQQAIEEMQKAMFRRLRFELVKIERSVA